MSTGVNIPTNSSEPIENQVIVICGPTSVGKSAVASRLCATLPSEMLLADAVQVYRHLDIGSNKPRQEEMISVPHHLVDICEPPFENFTAGEFVRTAVPIVDDIIGRGRLPVFVGGNTMWVQWLMQGTPDAPKGSDDLRKQVAQQLRELERAGDWEAGLLLLQKLDSSRAEKLFRNDWYRLSRYLEIAYSLRADDEGRVSKMEDGSSSSSSTATLQNTRQTHLSAYDVRGFFVTEDREQLYHTIDERCVDMLTNGLFEEVTSLLQRGLLPPDFIGTKSIGYRQTIRYLVKQPRTLGDMEALEDYIKDFASATRNYARRQLQWYRRDPAFLWLQIYRGSCNSSGEHFDAYEAVSREIRHWMGVPRMDFDNAAAEQMRQKNLSDKDFRALKASLHETNDEGKVAPSLSAKVLGLRRAEDAKSTKLKRYEMVDLGRNDKRMADLLRRADECALKLLNESPEVVEMFMATYRLEEVSKAARADDHSDEV